MTKKVKIEADMEGKKPRILHFRPNNKNIKFGPIIQYTKFRMI